MTTQQAMEYRRYMADCEGRGELPLPSMVWLTLVELGAGTN